MANPKPLMAKSSGTDHANAAIESALRTLDAEAGGVAAITAALQSDLRAPFVAAADRIRDAKGRLIVTGLGKSGHIGRKIAATFASTGTPAFFVHAAEASHGDLGMITADDVILALSWSGEQPEMKNLITYAKRFKIPLIAMTAERESTLANAADVALTLPKACEACPHNLAPTTSSLMQLALGDALAVAVKGRRALLVASTDLSHYHAADTARALDSIVIDCVSQLDADRLQHALAVQPEHACGGGPTVAVMRAAQQLGARDAVVLNYADSGDVSGDKSAVVGYLAAAIGRF